MTKGYAVTIVTVMENLPKLLLRAQSRGVSFAEIARRLGVSGSGVAKWANREATPGADMLPGLAEILEVDVYTLLDLDPPRGETGLVGDEDLLVATYRAHRPDTLRTLGYMIRHGTAPAVPDPGLTQHNSHGLDAGDHFDPPPPSPETGDEDAGLGRADRRPK